MSSTVNSVESKLREEIVRVGASLYQRGYVHSSAGNISVRLPEEIGGGWLITPTDACLGFLDPATLSKVDASGQQVSGDRASKTLVLHRGIYDAAPAASAVLHTHSTNLVALTLAGVWSERDILPPITPYYVLKVGHVPLIPYYRPGHPTVADLVRAEVGRSKAVMLDRLGPVVWHSSVSQAAYMLEELEETAKLWMSLEVKPEPLKDEQIQELCETFKVSW